MSGYSSHLLTETYQITDYSKRSLFIYGVEKMWLGMVWYYICNVDYALGCRHLRGIILHGYSTQSSYIVWLLIGLECKKIFALYLNILQM